jgi:hypothetical protein
VVERDELAGAWPMAVRACSARGGLAPASKVVQISQPHRSRKTNRS